MDCPIAQMKKLGTCTILEWERSDMPKRFKNATAWGAGVVELTNNQLGYLQNKKQWGGRKQAAAAAWAGWR
jgi:hypothetical protein